MTLVYALRTPHWVAIVADRMLSTRSGKRSIVERTPTTKLVMHRNQMLFGYTGIANLISPDAKIIVPTDEWLVRTLIDAGDRTLEQTINFVIERLNEVLPRLKAAANEIRIAFLGVGFAKLEKSPLDKPTAVSVLISNFHQVAIEKATGREFLVTCDPSDRCRGFPEVIPNNIGAAALSHAGFTPPNNEIQWLCERLDKASDEGRPPITMIHLLKESIQRISKSQPKHQKTVGKGILAAFLPIDADKDDTMVMSDPNGHCAIVLSNKELPEKLAELGPYLSEFRQCHFMRFSDDDDVGVYETPHLVGTGYKFMAACGSDLTIKGKNSLKIDHDPVSGVIRAIASFKLVGTTDRLRQIRARRRTKKKK